MRGGIPTGSTFRAVGHRLAPVVAGLALLVGLGVPAGPTYAMWSTGGGGTVTRPVTSVTGHGGTKKHQTSRKSHKGGKSSKHTGTNASGSGGNSQGLGGSTGGNSGGVVTGPCKTPQGANAGATCTTTTSVYSNGNGTTTKTVSQVSGNGGGNACGSNNSLCSQSTSWTTNWGPSHTTACTYPGYQTTTKTATTETETVTITSNGQVVSQHTITSNLPTPETISVQSPCDYTQTVGPQTSTYSQMGSCDPSTGWATNTTYEDSTYYTETWYGGTVVSASAIKHTPGYPKAIGTAKVACLGATGTKTWSTTTKGSTTCLSSGHEGYPETTTTYTQPYQIVGGYKVYGNTSTSTKTTIVDTGKACPSPPSSTHVQPVTTTEYQYVASGVSQCSSGQVQQQEIEESRTATYDPNTGTTTYSAWTPTGNTIWYGTGASCGTSTSTQTEWQATGQTTCQSGSLMDVQEEYERTATYDPISGKTSYSAWTPILVNGQPVTQNAPTGTSCGSGGQSGSSGPASLGTATVSITSTMPNGGALPAGQPAQGTSSLGEIIHVAFSPSLVGLPRGLTWSLTSATLSFRDCQAKTTPSSTEAQTTFCYGPGQSNTVAPNLDLAPWTMTISGQGAAKSFTENWDWFLGNYQNEETWSTASGLGDADAVPVTIGYTVTLSNGQTLSGTATSTLYLLGTLYAPKTGGNL